MNFSRLPEPVNRNYAFFVDFKRGRMLALLCKMLPGTLMRLDTLSPPQTVIVTGDVQSL